MHPFWQTVVWLPQILEQRYEILFLWSWYNFSQDVYQKILTNICLLDAIFRQIKSFRRFRLAFSFGLQTYYLIDFSKVYRLKHLNPKNKQNLMNDLIWRKNTFNLPTYIGKKCNVETRTTYSKSSSTRADHEWPHFAYQSFPLQ